MTNGLFKKITICLKWLIKLVQNGPEFQSIWIEREQSTWLKIDLTL